MSKKQNTVAAGPSETTAGRTPENLGTPGPAESAVPAPPQTFNAGLFKVRVRVAARTGEEIAYSVTGRTPTPDEVARYGAQPSRGEVVRVAAASEDAAKEHALRLHPGAQVLAIETFTPDRRSPAARSHEDHPDNFIQAA